jgi:hypothetical protein
MIANLDLETLHISVKARPALEPRDSKSAAWRLINQR